MHFYTFLFISSETILNSTLPYLAIVMVITFLTFESFWSTIFFHNFLHLIVLVDYAASKSWSLLEQIFHQQKTNFSERFIWWAICILFIQLFFLWFVDYDKITLFISCLLIQNAIYLKKKKEFFLSVFWIQENAVIKICKMDQHVL